MIVVILSEGGESLSLLMRIQIPHNVPHARHMILANAIGSGSIKNSIAHTTTSLRIKFLASLVEL